MTKKPTKVKQIATLFPYINGKQVKINPKGENWIATVTGWTGKYLVIKDVSNATTGRKVLTQMIHANAINLIELAPE